MLIPSIDLMGGRIVQLVQGERKALEFADFAPWIERFVRYPLVQLIDLDAARREGGNRELLAHFCAQLPCQVGGGVRTLDDAAALLAAGARRVILGSSLVREGAVDTAFARALAQRVGRERLVFAIDARAGRVAVAGWRQNTPLTPEQMIPALAPYCAAFLYTHIDGEGLMRGFPRERARALAALSPRRLIVAGGIRSEREVDELDKLGVDAVVGMAIYTGALELP